MAKAKRPSPAETAGTRITVVRGPRADGAWYWRARTKDVEQRTVWTGWGSREGAQRVVQELEARGLTQRPKEKRGPVHTVGDMLNDWIDHQEKRYTDTGASKHTFAHYKIAARHLIKWLEDVRIAAVTRPAVERYVSDRFAEQITAKGRRAARTVRQEVVIFGMAWNWTVEKHGPTFPGSVSFPWVDVKIPKGEHVNNHRTPSDEEITNVIQAVEDPAMRLALEILAEAGARIGEVASATAGSLDLRAEGGPELVFCGKTGTRRWPLSPGLTRRIVNATRHKLPAAPLVDREVADFQTKVQRAIDHACAALKIARFTPHGLRRAAVRRARRRGVGVKAAAELFGHSVKVMLDVYDELDREEVRRDAARASIGLLDG